MYIEKETQSAKCSFFAKNDIALRASQAVRNHPKLQSCPQHQATVQQVYNLLKYHAQFSDYKNIYTTCRNATSKSPANTEVKIDRMSSRMHNLPALKSAIAQLNLVLVYKKATVSYSVHVPLV